MKSLRFKILSVVLIALFAVGCQDDVKTTISGEFEGLAAEKVYLEKVADGAHLIDSVALDKEGRYSFTIKSVTEEPSLYNIVCNDNRIPLLVSSGESVKLKVADVCEVSGSTESQLLYLFYNDFVAGEAQLNAILQEYRAADKSARKALDKRYNDLYKEIKRKQITFIIENKEHLAAVYALYQRLPGEQYLSTAESDIVYYRTVAEAVSKHYPSASLVAMLNKNIATMQARADILNSVEVCSYPELEGKDMYGKVVPLSSLGGNVILVDFWSAEAGNNNVLNAELKELYKQYESQGFRVYQVSADTSKYIWIAAVQEQKLPWVSVCDFVGANSPMLLAYNVKKLPANFLIDRDGNIVAKNLYGEALKRELTKLLK